MNDRLEKILFIMFDELIEGVDQYNHQGSLWLILTDERKWILEFTKTKTLWYNYTIFKDRMSFAAMDCVENKEYITKWFESRFLNKPKAQDTLKRPRKLVQQVEDAIENGVKDTEIGWVKQYNEVEDTIQNGVKNTKALNLKIEESVGDTIQNGVKRTRRASNPFSSTVEDTIQNGVKDTPSCTSRRRNLVEDTIQNGVKQTKRSYEGSRKQRTNYVIENGVKETELHKGDRPLAIRDTIQHGVKN